MHGNNLKEVLVKKQLKQLKHRYNTVLPITPADICPSVKAAAIRPATPSTFPLNSTQRIDHKHHAWRPTGGMMGILIIVIIFTAMITYTVSGYWVEGGL